MTPEETTAHGVRLFVQWRTAADNSARALTGIDAAAAEEQRTHDLWADWASEHGLCYGCAGPDDTDGRATHCTTCDPIGAAERAREDAATERPWVAASGRRYATADVTDGHGGELREPVKFDPSGVLA